MKPSTPRGLPAPRSNAAVRSRNSQQYTQRLSIQNEGGFRFHWPLPAGARIQFFVDLSLGRMLRNLYDVPRLCHRPEPLSSVLSPLFRTKETGGPIASPVSLARFCVGKAWISQRLSAVNAAPGRRSQSMRRTTGLPNAEGGARGTGCVLWDWWGHGFFSASS